MLRYLAIVVGTLLMAIALVLAFPFGFVSSFFHARTLRSKRLTTAVLGARMDEGKLAVLLGSVPSWLAGTGSSDSEKVEWLNTVIKQVRWGWLA